MKNDIWPDLPYKEGKATYETIHLWTQIAGKIKIARLPWINHSWHVALYVTPYGLTTGDIPANGKHFQIDFDFLKHQLVIITSKSEERQFDLKTLSVASCYNNILNTLKDLGLETKINPIPNEIENPVPFPEDEKTATYIPEVAKNLHRVLLSTNKVFTDFRAGFIGKCSPVHFFWGSFDLAVTRFSGRKAPEHPGGFPNLPDRVAKEAYSHEVSSAGFWPGSEMLPFPAFYSYAYPQPEALQKAKIIPGAAYFHQDLGEFILPYRDLQKAEDPGKDLLDFLQSTYTVAADLGHWERSELEKKP